jgi:hypothetical protein
MQTYLNLDLSEAGPIRAPQYEFQADTMQVPCGQHSILWALGQKEVTAAEVIGYLSLNHASSWNSGVTWCVPERALSRSLGAGMSVRYTRSVLESLKEKGWISSISSGKVRRYRLVHHLCEKEDVPVDRDGKPLKFAVPRGDGGPFERLHARDISWKACLGWIVHKLYSDWKTGETYPCTTLDFAKRCRLSSKTMIPLTKQLVEADMLHRLSQPQKKSVFQLYPKPYPGLVTREDKPRSPIADDGVTSDGKFWYSSKGKYRCYRETLKIEFRVNRSGEKWKPVPDCDRHKIPPAVMLEFECHISAKREVEEAVFGKDMHFP